MSAPTGAVFLSYASEDVAAAERIAGALRAAGIEVWIDKSELRGGDAWDQSIRKQIKACALFIPIISRHAHDRIEGYFRLEWKLAVDRSHLIAPDQAFLMPVAVDDTPQSDERIPDRFRELQWTRLPGGETSPAFIERVQRLLSPEALTARGPGTTVLPTFATAEKSRKGPAPWWFKPALWAIGVVLAVALSYFVGDRIWLSKRVASAASTTGSAHSSSLAAPEKSIAVLPFVDMSEKHDQEYFSDGLSEELIDLLTKIPDLRVPARTSSFFFKGKPEDIATIAQRLHVAHVLEGSVRKAANTIRVTAQLIRADNGYHLWSETYDRDLKDIFKVQDEIAGAVVSALRVKLVRGQQAPNSHRTASPEAYNQYLLGRHLYQRGNPDHFRRAADAYRKAIELDPGYAAAYAELAMSESFADGDGNPTAQQQALAAADKAIELAPEVADGYAARGYLRLTVNWDWIGAEADLQKALALDSGNIRAHEQYAELLSAFGRLPEAVEAAKKATELDPLSNEAWSDLGLYLVENRQFAVANEALRRAVEIEPEGAYGLSWLGQLQLLEGKAMEALATFRQVDYEGFRLWGIAMAEHTLSHTKESQHSLDELIAKHATQGFASEVADIYAWRAEKDKAFEWLEQAYRQHDSDLVYIKSDPLLDSLHDDPRYKAILRKMNLPE
jgi:TolB-like protein/lipoprotein NlpI